MGEALASAVSSKLDALHEAVDEKTGLASRLQAREVELKRTMEQRAKVCHAMLCCAVLRHGVLCCAVMEQRSKVCHAVLCCAVVQCAALRCYVTRCAALCCSV